MFIFLSCFVCFLFLFVSCVGSMFPFGKVSLQNCGQLLRLCNLVALKLFLLCSILLYLYAACMQLLSRCLEYFIKNWGLRNVLNEEMKGSFYAEL